MKVLLGKIQDNPSEEQDLDHCPEKVMPWLPEDKLCPIAGFCHRYAEGSCPEEYRRLISGELDYATLEDPPANPIDGQTDDQTAGKKPANQAIRKRNLNITPIDNNAFVQNVKLMRKHIHDLNQNEYDAPFDEDLDEVPKIKLEDIDKKIAAEDESAMDDLYENCDRVGFHRMVAPPATELTVNFFRKHEVAHSVYRQERILIKHEVELNQCGIWVDETPFLFSPLMSGDYLPDAYRRWVGDYPKFYKMDKLSQMAFIATELLLQCEQFKEPGNERFLERDDRAVIFFCRSGSVITDRKHAAAISPEGDGLASPATFVYTLPNIATGEVAIRNKYLGETSCYILPHRDQRLMDVIIAEALIYGDAKSVIGGWMDLSDDGWMDAQLYIAERDTSRDDDPNHNT